MLTAGSLIADSLAAPGSGSPAVGHPLPTALALGAGTLRCQRVGCVWCVRRRGPRLEGDAARHLSQDAVTGWRIRVHSREEQWEQGAALHRQAAGECSTQGRAQQAQTSANTLTNLS